MTSDDVSDNRIELRHFSAVHQVSVVDSLIGTVGWNRDDAQLVDLIKLGCLGHGSTRHARQLVVHAEVVLKRHRGKCLVFVADFHAFLGLNGLMHPVVVSTPREDSTSVLINNQNFPIHHDIVLVALEEFLRFDRVVDETDERRIRRLVQVGDSEPRLGLRDAGLQDAHGALLFVDLVVLVADKSKCQTSTLGKVLGRLVCSPADDERCSCFIDED